MRLLNISPWLQKASWARVLVLLVSLAATAEMAQAIDVGVVTTSDDRTSKLARAVGIEIKTANDFLTKNKQKDDLYSFGFGVSLDLGRYDLKLSENAFTDRTNELRFDETYLTLSRALPALGRWQVHGEAGVVQVGEGIFGEGAQNSLHSLLGDEEVELPYIESSSLHPTLGLTFSRNLASLGPVATGAEIQAFSAVDFKSHASVLFRASWQALDPVRLEAGFGARYTQTDFDPLEPWVSSVGAQVELGVDLYDRYLLTWTYNEYGTKMQHFQLGYRLATGKLGTGDR